MPRLRTDSLDIAFDRRGEGPVLLLLHPAFLDRMVWARVMPRLAERFDVVAPDLPGHGLSEAVRPDLVGFVREFMDALGIREAFAAGASLGGGVLIRAAAEEPARFRKLVLFAPTGIPKVEMDAVRERVPKSKSTWEAFRGAFEDPGLATPERYREYAALQKRAAPFMRRYRETHPPDYARVGWVPQMRRIRCPTLLVWGDRDPIIPPPMDRRTQEEIPGSKLVVLAGAKHFPYLDRPEETARLVTEFLDKNT